MECILFVGLSFSWIHEKAAEEIRRWVVDEQIPIDPQGIPKLPLSPSFGARADFECLPSKEFGVGISDEHSARAALEP
jgi:hypothetical protein